MVTRRRTIAAGAALATVASLYACGAPELTYRDGEPTGPDAAADADGAIHPDGVVDQLADVPDTKPEAHDAATDLASEAKLDSPTDTTIDPTAEPIDAPEDPQDATVDSDGDAGPEASADAEVDSGPACPVGMVSVPKATAGSYCIDATEVRQGDWAVWLATNPATGGQPAGCSGNASFAPDTAGACALAYSPGTTPNLPVVCIDWCDAVAYCSAQGKRLCGNVEGGAAAFAAFTDASFDQWHRACTFGGSRTYPYGGSYAAGTCADTTGASTPVASKAGCEGGFPGIFDMSGNVSEWEDACNGTNANSRCRLRGGSFQDTGAQVACGAAADEKRLTRSATIGLRCCSS